MYILWTLVVACLAIALSDNGLIGSIAQALGFALVLWIAIKQKGDSTKKSSHRLLARVKPSHYDKVL
ncbi:hypothetical protein A9264_12315 [Vibrio sp. UCD-FRSSP16_10]|uniref:hypothetical protein n=1 Tax=unclassified Vibrio TaxID=2614977 RepID=UPI000801167B|nr:MULTISPECIES: hypothetical protein [unclassified Vibrio]OBT16039.1 hypothetical protein A9260_12530 [Vibrio sp. UCD-FRSSP16_30]OBT21121.1 hypothetical protein A9264_12315 [Vibrio sp. UCD-FRSSP16_10]